MSSNKIENPLTTGYIDKIRPRILDDIDIWASGDGAEKKGNVFLDPSITHYPGIYDRFKTPYLIEPLKALSPSSRAEVIAIKKSVQSGATIAVVLISSLYVIFHQLGNILCIFPSETKAKKFSRKRLERVLDNLAIFKDAVVKKKSRASGNTILDKDFGAFSISLRGGGSDNAFKSDDIFLAIMDEADGVAMNIGKDGSTIKLLEARGASYPQGTAKAVFNSTPTSKGYSNIDLAYDESSQGRYCVPCTRCGEFQFLVFENLRYTKTTGGVIDAYYVCEHCKGRIEEHEKKDFLPLGKYIHKFPELVERRPGFHFNALTIPPGWKYNWCKIAEDYETAKKKLKEGDSGLMQTFFNNLLALSYDFVGERPDWEAIQKREIPYKKAPGAGFILVPKGFHLLTMGVDTQDDRLAVGIYAWGQDERGVCIHYTELPGDPDEQPVKGRAHAPVFEALLDLLERPYPTYSGAALRIASAAIDTGGHRTDAVYKFCKANKNLIVPIKGGDTAGLPISRIPSQVEVTSHGKKKKFGLKRWTVGSNSIRDLIYGRLAKTELGAKRFHFPEGLGPDFYRQLCNKHWITKFVNGQPKGHYENISKSVGAEVLDTLVYAFAALARINDTVRWGALERGIDEFVPGIVSKKKKKKKRSQTETFQW